jgi:ABC-type branched-subunit amino acid transport system substrate-binding protein
MRKHRIVAMAAVVVVSLGASTIASGAQSGGNEASEVGVSAKEIRIAVIADVDNQFRPGLFGGSPDAVKGFAKYVNKTGGIAGRKLAVDFIDSHLSPDEARTAVIKACQDDFAIVGTAALFLSNVDDMVGCPDKAGAATGIPDIPIVTTEAAQQCSPVSFPINPSQLLCSTKDQHPQTWRANQGPIKYYVRARKEKLHGIAVYASDIKAAAVAGQALAGGAQAGGVKDDGVIGVSALATQAEFTPVVQKAKDVSANYVLNTSDFNTDVKLRREAKLQGIDSANVVWDCFSNCYDEQMIEQGGADVEGQYVVLNQLPFSETKDNKALANYVKYTGKDKIDGFGAYAWIAGILFRDAVNSVVKASGNNGLTRTALLDALGKTTRFDADGMWGTTDIGNRVPSACFLVMQVKDGEFERVYPTKPGTFDCKASNSIEFKADLLT